MINNTHGTRKTGLNEYIPIPAIIKTGKAAVRNVKSCFILKWQFKSPCTSQSLQEFSTQVYNGCFGSKNNLICKIVEIPWQLSRLIFDCLPPKIFTSIRVKLVIATYMVNYMLGKTILERSQNQRNYCSIKTWSISPARKLPLGSRVHSS